MKVYTKWDLPYRLHYARSKRIGPLVLDLELHWTTSSRQSPTPATNWPTGSGGWDNAHQPMQAIFVAIGPSFRSSLKVKPFENVHLYHLMCTLVQLSPAANEGLAGALDHLLLLSAAPPLPPVAPNGYNMAAILRLPTDRSAYYQQMMNRRCGDLDGSQSSWDRDQVLRMSPSEETAALAFHCPLGVPVSSSSSSKQSANYGLLVNREYVTGDFIALEINLKLITKLITKLMIFLKMS